MTLLEMAFAGISGLDVHVTHRRGKAIPILFSEEAGWVLEVLEKDLEHCLSVFQVCWLFLIKKSHIARVFKL